MSAPRRSICIFMGLALMLFAKASVWGAIGSQNVLVLYNTASPEGIDLANYYAGKHPGVHLLGLTDVTTAEDITADEYLLNDDVNQRYGIRQQILRSGLLTSDIDVIVTTKGLPLRITVQESNPGTYVDPFGITRSVGLGSAPPYYGWWRQYSSLESELTRLDVISTWQQMGDQTYNAQTGLPNYPQPSRNPYYFVSSEFDYNTYNKPNYGGMRLSARLDGFTVDEVKASIDSAQQTYIISNSRWVVVDDDPTAGFDLMPSLVNYVLTPRSQAHDYETTDAAKTTASGPVIGYVSHGVNDGDGGLQTAAYMENQLLYNPDTQSGLYLVNGAVFNTHESYNAYTFNCSPGENPRGQGLVADWLHIGGTAGVGNVEEPMNYSDTVSNEDQMIKMLLKGRTWGEAAWSSLQELSYVNTVVGDPLMTWKQVLPGDANMDGKVTALDLSILGANWGSTGQAGGYMWNLGDFNADGHISALDLSIMAANWGHVASWAGGGAPLAGGDLDIEGFLASVPEPSFALLAASALLTIFLVSKLRRLRRFTPLS